MLAPTARIAALAALAASGAGCNIDTVAVAYGVYPDSCATLPPVGHVRAPGASHPGDGPPVVYAIRTLYLGDTDRAGTVDKVNGWKHYGLDLDGKVSTADSTDLCLPFNNSRKRVYPDGENGIDNAFGRSILPVVLGIASDAPQKINAMIAAGGHTVLLRIEGLGSDSEYRPLRASLYGGATRATPPAWDGTDVWPVRPESLTDPANIESPKVVFPDSYVACGTWVSGPAADPVALDIRLGVSGFTFTLPLRHVVLTMDPSPDRRTATHGTLAGILDAQELSDSLAKVAAAFCGPIEEPLDPRPFSDILADGTQDPTKVCNGISLGLGFEMTEVKLGTVAAPDPLAPPPCK